MKLGLSKKGDPRGKHLVLVVPRKDNYMANFVVCEEVLNGVVDPVYEFDAAHDCFRYLFSTTYLDRIMLAFPQAELSPALDRYMIKQQKKEFAKIPVPDLEIPGFYDYKLEEPAEPYDFQKVGIGEIEKRIDELSDDDLRGLMAESEDLAQDMGELPAYFLNDEMGLGKTIQALGVAVRNRWFPAIFVVPNSGKWSTARIIERLFDDDFTYEIVDGAAAKRTEQITSGADVTIVNFESIRVKRQYDRSTRTWIEDIKHPEFFYEADGINKRVYEFAVIDEHHRIKNPTAQATAGFFKLRAHRWLMMSGTPIMNRIEEIWTVLHKSDPQRFPTYYQFEQELCIKDGSATIGYRPEKVIEIKDYLAKRSIRRRRDHISDDLPDVVYVPRPVVLTAEQRRLYNEIRDELLMELEDGSKKKVFNMLTRMTRLKQACFSPELYGGSKKSSKIDEMKIDVEQLVASGEKAIIFSQWSKAARILEREFAQYNPAYVDGSVKGKNRSEQEDKFNTDDDCKLYIGTIGANREAITLSAATYVLFADIPWTPTEMDQATARSAAGGLRGMGLPEGTKVHVLEYLAQETIEDWIQEVLHKKRQTFNSFVERDGGQRREKITMGDIKSLLTRVA